MWTLIRWFWPFHLCASIRWANANGQFCVRPATGLAKHGFSEILCTRASQLLCGRLAESALNRNLSIRNRCPLFVRARVRMLVPTTHRLILFVRPGPVCTPHVNTVTSHRHRCVRSMHAKLYCIHWDVKLNDRVYAAAANYEWEK